MTKNYMHASLLVIAMVAAQANAESIKEKAINALKNADAEVVLRDPRFDDIFDPFGNPFGTGMATRDAVQSSVTPQEVSTPNKVIAQPVKPIQIVKPEFIKPEYIRPEKEEFVMESVSPELRRKFFLITGSIVFAIVATALISEYDGFVHFSAMLSKIWNAAGTRLTSAQMPPSAQ